MLDFQKAQWKFMKIELENLHDAIIRIKNPKEAYDKWHTEICTLIGKYIPEYRIKKNQSPPWFDKDLRKLNRRKLAAHKKWKINSSNENFLMFCEKREEFKDTFKYKKKQYLDKVASQITTNPKLFWRTFNYKTKTNQNSQSLQQQQC